MQQGNGAFFDTLRKRMRNAALENNDDEARKIAMASFS